MIYEYVVVGAGIAGCSVAHEIRKKTSSILLIEKNESIAQGASGAAGAFLSPLLGKPNDFKDLVNNALVYSVDYYKTNFSNCINNCGTLRIPKDTVAQKQFTSYQPYIDFDYTQKDDGYFFPIGSVVDSKGICESLTKDVKKLFNTNIDTLDFNGGIYLLNNSIKTKKIILTTGHCTKLIDELYLNIRAVWGQRIDVKTSSKTSYNYHKNCSVSISTPMSDDFNRVSIGATHHRFVDHKEIDEEDTKKLLDLASQIVQLDNVEVINQVAGARASSMDYFPIVGSLVDSTLTFKHYPYIKKGSKVPVEKYTVYPNLFVLNGLGGRGFVLAAYLANILVNNLFDQQSINKNIQSHRLFQRWARKQH
ncbi:MAG: FAD-dependent oxidoreductase [Campylobacterota bacterium]|nr:FAD-dependent oxidoreductase [Campylobacterota bacterium]